MNIDIFAPVTDADYEPFEPGLHENVDPADVLTPDEWTEYLAERERAKQRKAKIGNGQAHEKKPKTMLDAALGYVALGWRILPVHWMQNGKCSCGDAACRTPGKHPIPAHGHLDASSDLATIRGWWTRHPNANIGLYCAGSGVVVVDVDPRNGGDKTFNELEAKYGPLNASVVSNTGGGGQHYLLPATNGAAFPGKLGQGIELKHNGMIVLPPSNHMSGGHYEWAKGHDPFAHDVKDGDISTLLARLPKEEARAEGATNNNDSEPIDLAFDDFTNAVMSISNEGDGVDYDEWVRIGAAIHHQLRGSPLGLELFDKWSRLCDRAEPKKTKTTWNSFGRHEGAQVTARTITQLARANGWKPLYETSDRMIGDVTLAREFACKHGHKFRYVVENKEWLYWDGNRWNRHLAGHHVFVLLQNMLASKLNEAADALKQSLINKHDDVEPEEEAAPKDKKPKKGKAKPQSSDAAEAELKAVTAYLKDAKKLKAVLSILPMQQGIFTSALDYDRDPMLLGVKNGVVDLRTGRLLPPDPKHNITKCAGCEYDPNAKCPQFDAFLDKVQPNKDSRKFWWAATGYTLTGCIDEEKLFFEHGEGDNGKSISANVRKAALGDYAVVINAESLMSQKNQNSEQKRDIVKLVGARMALANETPVGTMWNDSFVKMLASREDIPGRKLYAEGFDFPPTHKTWVRGNNIPGVLDASDGFWRRLTSIPYAVKITEEEKIKDLDKRIIRDELPGVLAAAVRGCLLWQKEGLCIPKDVEDDTAKYRAETDIIGMWLEERIEKDPGACTATKELWHNYASYCSDHGIHRYLSCIGLGRALVARGYKTGEAGRKVRGIQGLKLETPF